MIEKTLRYPGHIEKIRVMRETGLFSKEEIEEGRKKVRPIDVTTRLLFPMWELKDGDEDLTVMKIIVEGMKDGRKQRHTWSLFDVYDTQSGIHSMARTTGYTATAAVRLVAEGLYSQTGISAPEFVGRHPECVEFMLEKLHERGIDYKELIENII